MSFLAIYKKEMREVLPLTVGAALFFGLIATVIVMSGALSWQYSGGWYEQDDMPIPGSYFREGSPVNGTGSLVLFISFVFGLSLGVIQFWKPKFSKTWAFTLHRSISREGILFAKLAASVTAFILAMGIPWILYCWYISRPGLLPMPLSFREFLSGGVYILTGLLIYTGTAASVLSMDKWSGTKICCLVFAIIMMVIAFIAQSFLGFTITVVTGLAILLAQLFNMFMSREY